jgi:hypothetical protein
VYFGQKHHLELFWQIKGHNSRTAKIIKYKIKAGVPFMVPELVNK